MTLLLFLGDYLFMQHYIILCFLSNYISQITKTNLIRIPLVNYWFDVYIFVIQEEHEAIRASKGENEALEWDDYKSMSFTQCVSKMIILYASISICWYLIVIKNESLIWSQVVNETLRIANIISGIFRRTMTDVTIKGENALHA